jgi:hypothetical protein
MSASSRSGVSRPRSLASVMASSTSAASWVVKALVEATPISGPARVRNLRPAARISADSGTLQMARLCTWPSERACWSAASVSAVSPDCEMVTTRVDGLGTESR